MTRSLRRGISPPLTFAESAPDPRLTQWCARYWGFTVGDQAPPMHHVPPDGAASLLLKLSDERPIVVIASGPWLSPLTVPVHAGEKFVGVRIQTGAVQALLGLTPALLLNRVIPLVQLIGTEALTLAAAFEDCDGLDDAKPIFDRYFLAKLATLQAPDPLVREAVELLVAARGEGAISLIAEQLRTSQRTLLRRFKDATGLTPKQYNRICRFRFAAIELVNAEPTLTEVAAKGGYSDQAHLHHEVLSLTGLTPAALAARVASIRHENLSR